MNLINRLIYCSTFLQSSKNAVTLRPLVVLLFHYYYIYVSIGGEMRLLAVSDVCLLRWRALVGEVGCL